MGGALNADKVNSLWACFHVENGFAAGKRCGLEYGALCIQQLDDALMVVCIKPKHTQFLCAKKNDIHYKRTIFFVKITKAQPLKHRRICNNLL